MKKIKSIFIVPFLALAILLLLPISCKKDDDKTPTGIRDIDGNVYDTIRIGTQVWMLENLKTTRYRNGDPISNVTDSTAWYGLLTGAYSNYDNSPGNTVIYGRLYNWFAVQDARNISPAGWHVPTETEWETLTNALGGYLVAGGKLKEAGTFHWQSPNIGATNVTGFTALPGGFRNFTGNFEHIGFYGHWWTSTGFNAISAIGQRMSSIDDDVVPAAFFKTYGFGVRCVKD